VCKGKRESYLEGGRKERVLKNEKRGREKGKSYK
jgi:hypothetical protein